MLEESASIGRHSSGHNSMERGHTRSPIGGKHQPRGASVSMHRLTADNASVNMSGGHYDTDAYTPVRPASADPRSAAFSRLAPESAGRVESFNLRRNVFIFKIIFQFKRGR